MRRLLAAALLLAAPLLADEAWERTLSEIAAIPEDAAALARIDQVARDVSEDPLRLAELLVRCKVPRVPMLQKGAVSVEAIGLLEKFLEKEPENTRARYLLARTCAALPPFFGRREQAIRELRALAAGDAPVDVYLRLAALEREAGRAEEARKALELGLSKHPENEALRRALAPEGARDTTRGVERFYEALAANRMDFEALDAALAAAPDSAPLLRGLLRLWRMELPGLAAAESAAMAADAAAAFRKAQALDPDDTRIDGWLGPLLHLTAKLGGAPAEVAAEGERLMARGVERNPEQNLFGRAFAHAVLARREEDPAARAAHVAQVAADMARTFEICAGRTDHPSCTNTPRTPHNLEGTFYWTAEFWRVEGELEKARELYRRALAVPDAATWPHRPLAEGRLAQVERILEGERAGQLPPNPASCALCHQR